jgi:hypothetical protein
MKYYFYLALTISILLTNCSDPVSSEISHYYEFIIEYENTGVWKDTDGLYHLKVDTTRWQTLYRVRGLVLKDGLPIENVSISWSSNLYWYLGRDDFYIVKRKLSDDVVWVNYDTTSIDFFEDFVVPTTNIRSITNSKGEWSNMIAPVRIQKGEILILSYLSYDMMEMNGDYMEGEIKFILE